MQPGLPLEREREGEGVGYISHMRVHVRPSVNIMLIVCHFNGRPPTAICRLCSTITTLLTEVGEVVPLL